MSVYDESQKSLLDWFYVGDDLTIEVYDEDVTADDVVGVATIKLSALCVNNGIDEWFQVAHKGKSAGQVHLKSVWKAVGAGAAAQPGAAQPGAAQQAQMQQ